MKQGHRPIAFFCGAMTFSWMIVWVSFVTAPVIGRRFSLLDALTGFTLAALIAIWSNNRRMRNYQIVGLHMICLAVLVGHTLYTIFYSVSPFFSMVWLKTLALEIGDLKRFLTILLVVICTVAFWVAGVRLGRRTLNYMTVCNRFDLGLTALFALLLIQLILVIRGGLIISAPPEAFYIYSFFLCGLLAIGLARHDSMVDKKFLPGIRGVTILLIIAVAMITATGMMATVAPPVLTPLAEDGYVVVKTVARPLGALITRFLIFIFKRDVDLKVEMGGPTGSPGELIAGETNEWGFWLARILAEGLIGLLFLGLLLLIGYGLWRFINWMLKRGAGSIEPPGLRSWWVEFLIRIWAWLQYRMRSIRVYKGRPGHIGHLFAALQSWGRSGGVSRRQYETPCEYAGRLCERFPQTAEDINTIVSAYQISIYGEKPLGRNSITASHSAWRRLRSPKHWAARWRALFDRPQTP